MESAVSSVWLKGDRPCALAPHEMPETVTANLILSSGQALQKPTDACVGSKGYKAAILAMICMVNERTETSRDKS